MAESVFATPPSPDLSDDDNNDDDLHMHHPVVILDERPTMAVQQHPTTTDNDDQHGNDDDDVDRSMKSTTAPISSPLSHHSDATPATNAGDSNNETGAPPPLSDDPMNDGTHFTTTHHTAFPNNFQLPPPQQQQHQRQPPQPQHSQHPSPSQSPDSNPGVEQLSPTTASGHLLASPHNQFALPFADFAAQLLRASGSNGTSGGGGEHHSKSKRRKQSTPNRVSANNTLMMNDAALGSAAAAAAAVGFPGGGDDDPNSVENVARRQFLADFTQKLAAIVEQQEFDKSATAAAATGDVNNGHRHHHHHHQQQHAANNYDANEEDSRDDEDGGTNETASLENGELQQSHHHQARHGQQQPLFCGQCPDERFESELKLGLHMLQVHGSGSAAGARGEAQHHLDADQMPFQIRVKKELKWDTADDGEQIQMQSMPPQLQQQQQQQQRNDAGDNRSSGLPAMHGLSQPDANWLPMGGGLPFPFSAEAAAMLSASGYLGQMPQLLAGQMAGGYGGGAGGADGLSRPNIPPIRIFNPEAYCDLCNKEFCNKYFLKTHKANKHNIYEPSSSSSSGASTTTTTTTASSASSLGADGHQSSTSQQQQQQFNHMSQMYMQQQQHHHHQMQLNQQHQQQQQQQLLSHEHQPQPLHHHHQHALSAAVQQAPPPVVDTTVPCDICHRRFSNAASMRRHRAKAHEQPAAAAAAASATAATTPGHGPDMSGDVKTEHTPKFTLPDGFREDFTVEQEDTSFTPQIRKLSPASSQLARDSNFSNDKLRRLGVINPEAFCEICCKEYCNKYFLRTHKIKRHGIFMPMDGEQQQQHHSQLQQQQPPTTAAAALLSGFMGKEDAGKWLQFVQTTPLNLMMGMKHELNLASAKRTSEALQRDDAGEENRSRPATTTTPDAKRSKLDANDGGVGGGEQSNATAQPDAQQQAAQDAISVDLQKLQSMIMQLNDLSAHRPATCSICTKEFDNQYVLHAHVLAEHAPPGDNNNDGGSTHNNGSTGGQQLKSSPPGTPPPAPPPQPAAALLPSLQLSHAAHLHTGSPTSADLTCKHCDKECGSELALRLHMFEAHAGQMGGVSSVANTSALALQHFAKKMATVDAYGGSSGGSGNNGSFVGGSGGVGGNVDRKPYTITPTSSYCQLCNKELCNKYFMKTHMQRMHGIEIENGAQIGGVICNICNKELCSKYFLRVHKHNTHGIVDEGAPLPVPRGSSSSTNANASNLAAAAAAAVAADSANGDHGDHHQKQSSGSSPGGSMDLKPGEVSNDPMATGNNRYYAHISEPCPLCSRRFRGAKWLRTHLMSDHGKMGVDKLRDMEHSLALTKQQNSSPTLRIPGSGGSSGGISSNPFGFGSQQQTTTSSSRGAAVKQPHQQQHHHHHKHDISSLFGPGQLADDTGSHHHQHHHNNTGGVGGGKTKEYSCSFCPFTTPSYAFLFIHERSHSLMGIAQQQQQQQQPTDDTAEPPKPDLPPASSHNGHITEQRQQANISPFGLQFPALIASSPSPRPSSTPLQQHALDVTTPPRRSPLTPIEHSRSSAGAAAVTTSTTTTTTTTPPPPASLQTPPPPPAAATTTSGRVAAATHAMLNDLANAAKLPTAYALPAHGGAHDSNGSEPPLVMQSFLMEEQEHDYGDGTSDMDGGGGAERERHRRFVPSIVYLPVKQRFPDKLVVSFTLTPA